MKRFFFTIVPILLLAFVSLFTGSGCANIVPPSGGPRDSLPPVLVNATPADSSTNFRANRITLTFDEYIDLQEVQQNLLFTPIFETNPIVEARLRTTYHPPKRFAGKQHHLYFQLWQCHPRHQRRQYSAQFRLYFFYRPLYRFAADQRPGYSGANGHYRQYADCGVAP